jgi:hypothetical protein
MKLDGLTERQVELLDTMWAIDEFTDLEDWMETLSKEDKAEAELLQRLVILEEFEAMLATSKYPEANRVIDQFRLTK